MNPTDIDPSLCSGEPQDGRLDDGYSPSAAERADGLPGAGPAGAEPVLQAKSLF